MVVDDDFRVADLHARFVGRVAGVPADGLRKRNPRVPSDGSPVRRPAWVEVSLLAEADILHLVVVDSGDGVPAEAVDRLFDQDFTTTTDDARPHGVGHSLGN